MQLPSSARLIAGASVLTAALMVLSACGGSTEKAAAPAANSKSTASNSISTDKLVTTSPTAGLSAKAKSAPLKVEPAPEPTNEGTAASAGTPSGKQTTVDAAAPTVGGTSTALSTEASSTKKVVDSKIWTKHGKAPARTSGLLFFQGRNGNYYSCTGTVINTKGKNRVLTAGHCVKENASGGKIVRMIFIPDFHGWQPVLNDFDPSYNDSRAPAGIWIATDWSAPSAWVNSENSNYDYATVRFAKRYGHNVQNYTGGQGWKINYKGRAFNVTAFGYPGDLLPSGKKINYTNLRYCRGRTYAIKILKSNGRAYPGPKELALRCNMGHGASGGPWISSLNSKGMGYLVGVSSTHSLSTKTMHAAYFGKLLKKVVSHA